MSTFADYAALARLLAEQRRAGERGAAAEAERRRSLHAAVDSLQHRLTAQGQRLDQLGRAIGAAPPAGPPAPSVDPASPAVGSPGGSGHPGVPPGPPPPAGFAPPADLPSPPPAASPPTAPPGGASVTGPAWAASSAGPGPRGTVGASAPPPATGSPVPPPGPAPQAPWAGYPGGHAGPGTGSTGGAAAAPGRPGVEAYLRGGPGETALAVPAAGAVPGPRAGEADPAAELELARRYADEADRHGQQAELLAQRPPLLPTWSPAARALAVYLGCAGVGVVLMLVMVFASGVGVVDLGTLYAWMCAGLPAVSLIAGWLVLGRWGQPPMVAGTPPRYPVLGILVCFLAVPLAYCGYLLLFRTVF